MDPTLLPGSEIIVPDPNPAKMKEQITKYFIFKFRPLNSGLYVLKDCTMKQKMTDTVQCTVVGKFFLIEFKVCF